MSLRRAIPIGVVTPLSGATTINRPLREWPGIGQSLERVIALRFEPSWGSANIDTQWTVIVDQVRLAGFILDDGFSLSLSAMYGKEWPIEAIPIGNVDLSVEFVNILGKDASGASSNEGSIAVYAIVELDECVSPC